MSIPEHFFIERQGKKMVLYAGLLAEAHGRGLKSIQTQLIQVNMDDNGEPLYALVHAVATTEQGVFEGIGDATRSNVGRNIAPHLIRMAETRAKARALRDAINVGVTALEELGDEDSPANRSQQQTKPKAAAQANAQANAHTRGQTHDEALAEIFMFYRTMPEDDRPPWDDVQESAERSVEYANATLARLKQKLSQSSQPREEAS